MSLSAHRAGTGVPEWGGRWGSIHCGHRPPQAERVPGHQSLTPSPFGVFTPDAWLKGPRKRKWLLLLLIFVMGAGCNNRGCRGERATAQQDPHPLLHSPGRSNADGAPEEGLEKLSQKCSKFLFVWGAVICVSLCMLSVSHPVFMVLMVQSASVSSLPVCPMCISICLA